MTRRVRTQTSQIMIKVPQTSQIVIKVHMGPKDTSAAATSPPAISVAWLAPKGRPASGCRGAPDRRLRPRLPGAGGRRVTCNGGGIGPPPPDVTSNGGGEPI